MTQPEGGQNRQYGEKSDFWPEVLTSARKSELLAHVRGEDPLQHEYNRGRSHTPGDSFLKEDGGRIRTFRRRRDAHPDGEFRNSSYAPFAQPINNPEPLISMDRRGNGDSE